MEDRSAKRRPRLGVIGLGNVGNALRHTLSFYYDTVGYDIRKDFPWEAILETDVVFVCVPTPSGLDGRLDCDSVREVLGRLAANEYRGLVAVRSTVRVGFMGEATRTFPGLRLVYFPEFLRERSRLQWSVCPDRLVVGGDPDDCERILSYFDWVEEATRLQMTYLDAEVGKLAHNAFIATKVSFTNEIERICREQGADPEEVMSVVAADRRVGSKEHLRPGLGPYEGSCVPKDTRELRLAASRPVLLAAVEVVNEDVRARQGNGFPRGPVDTTLVPRQPPLEGHT
jgi:UDPglucose 6-dehydrogenase